LLFENVDVSCFQSQPQLLNFSDQATSIHLNKINPIVKYQKRAFLKEKNITLNGFGILVIQH